MKLLAYQTVKITIAVIASIFIASQLGLDYALSSGIVTMLTLFDIKRKSIKLGLKRFYTALIASSIAFASFYIFGFSLPAFGFYLLLFIPICIRLDARVGIVVNTVLVSHLLQNNAINLHGILNEVFILLIGIIIALFFNLHTPNTERVIKDLQVQVEEELKDVLRLMGENLINQCEINQKKVSLKAFYISIQEGLEMAKSYKNSYYLKDNTYFMDYFEMRSKQYDRLQYMSEHMKVVIVAEKEAAIISEFTNHIADRIHEFNSGQGLLQDLDQVRSSFRTSLLPQTREEFENRAMLFQYLNDMEAFISIKVDFARKYGVGGSLN